MLANSDLLENERDKLAARLSRIDRLLVRRYENPRFNLTPSQRAELERERKEIRAKLWRFMTT